MSGENVRIGVANAIQWYRRNVLNACDNKAPAMETDKTPKVRLDMADFTLAYGVAVEDAVGKRHTLQLTIKRDRVRSSPDASASVAHIRT